MPRDQHSGSSNALGHRCEAAWARKYIDGIEDPDREWNDPTADNRQRAAGLGKAMHAVGEAHYKFEVVAEQWETRPGMLMLRALEHAPPRGPGVTAEGEITLEHNGIKWRGYVDLTDRRHKAIADVYDWKSTSDISAWAKTPAELEDDLAAALYATYTAGGFGVAWDRVRCRWVYVQTKGTARTKAVDFVITREAALHILDRETEFAKHLDTIESFETATKNPLACYDFNATCQHHHTRGGPCRPTAPNKYAPGALVHLGPPKRRTEPMTQIIPNGATPLGTAVGGARNRFANRTGATAPPQVVPPATTPVVVETTGAVVPPNADTAPVSANADTQPAAKPPRQPRAPRTPPAAPPAEVAAANSPPVTEAGANVLKLASEFAAADAENTAAHEALRVASDALEVAGNTARVASEKRSAAAAALAAAVGA